MPLPGYGKGSIYHRRGDGLWVASIADPTPERPRRVKTFGSRDRAVVEARLAQWLTEHPPRRTEAPRSRDHYMAQAQTLGTHTRAEWWEVLRACQGRCYYCGEHWGQSLEKDHMTPVSRGGSDGIDNLAPACPPCNSRKTNMTAAEFINYTRARAGLEEIA